MLIEADTSATTMILTQNTWHYIDICVSNDNASGVVELDGVDHTGSFNPGDNDVRYFRMGQTHDTDGDLTLRFQFDAVAYFVDADGDSPIGP